MFTWEQTVWRKRYKRTLRPRSPEVRASRKLNEEPAILARIRRGERIEHYETVRRRKDGSLIDNSLTVSPVKDGGTS
jgi:hypothetical protein